MPNCRSALVAALPARYDVYVVKVSPVGAAISLAVEILLLVAVWRWGRPRHTSVPMPSF